MGIIVPIQKTFNSKNMNPFDANERHRYIVESGGYPATSPDGQEKEMWVNSINIDLDIPIYRYMKWEYLQQFYSRPIHEWILVRPCLWQDKFEQFIFKCDRVHSRQMNMDIGISNLADQYYAQCWTIIEESSLQWQVNKQHSNSCHDNISDDDNGEIWVKVRSTPRKLLGAMFYSSDNLVENTLNIMTYFIGKVEYLDSKTIENFMITDPNQLMDQSGIQQVLFLLQKRMPYQQEQEVRLIMQVDSGFCSRHQSDIIGRKIDNWYDLIDEIVLDPWVTQDQEKEVKSYLSQLARQQNRTPICCWKSHLNDHPQYLVPILDI